MTEEELIATCRGRGPRALAAFYEYLQAADGFRLPDHLFPVVLALTDTRIKKLQLQIGPGAGKALHPSTPVLTRRGWLPIGHIQVGDMIVRPDGQSVSEVRAVLPQEPSRLFRLTFADGREVLANAQHLWRVHNKKFQDRGAGLSWRTRTTEELASFMHEDRNKRSLRWYVPLVEAIDYPEADLPVDPYLLGALLGDGHFYPNGFAVLTCFDEETVTRLRDIGLSQDFSLSDYGPGRFGVRGICPQVRDLGLEASRSWDKRIPDEYFLGSAEQRYALLQGLLDADGTVGRNHDVSYCTVSQGMAEDVQRMVWSLGGIAAIRSKIPNFTHKGEKRAGRRAYTVSIRHPEAYRLFALSRKVDRARGNQYAESLKLEIVDIVPAEIEPSVCISIAHPDGLFICGDYIVTHNSQLLSIVYPTWMLGHDPQQTILGISGAENLAQGFMGSVMNGIEFNPAFQKCFPKVTPDKDKGWSTDRGAFVVGRRGSVPDAGFWACGLSSKALTGKHAQTVILDDLHDADNSATEVQCSGVVYKYTTQITGRADPMGARFILAGRRWHENDLYGTLADNGDWVTLVIPAERKGSRDLWVDITVPDNLACVFTDGIVQTPDLLESEQFLDPSLLPPHTIRMAGDVESDQIALRQIKWFYGTDPKEQGFFWPQSDHKRNEYFSNKRLQPAATEAVYQCNPGARAGIVFEEQDFERHYVEPEGIEYGIASPAVRQFVERGALLVQSWDTAFSAESTSDYTVGTTLLCVPCSSYHRGEDESQLGPCEHHFDIYLLDVYRARKKYAELVGVIKQQFMKWQPSVVVVEKKAYGVTLVETLPAAGIPVEGVSPGPLESKRARAVEGVGAGSVQGWCRQHRVLFPTDQPWLAEFKRELKNFTGERGGRDDQVDAFVHGVIYAIRNGVGSASIPRDWADTAQVDAQMFGQESHSFASMLGVENSLNPLDGTCANCRFFSDVIRARNLQTNQDMSGIPASHCTFHRQTTIGFAGCDDYSDPDLALFPTH